MSQRKREVDVSDNPIINDRKKLAPKRFIVQPIPPLPKEENGEANLSLEEELASEVVAPLANSGSNWRKAAVR